MLEKNLLTYTKTSSYEDFITFKSSKKSDILFVDSKFDDQHNFCLALNYDNSCKESLSIEKFTDFASSIILFKIYGDNHKNSQFLLEKITQNRNSFKNYFIIRVDDGQNILNSLQDLLSSSEDIYDIFFNSIAMGISGEIYFINNQAEISQIFINSLFDKVRYNRDIVPQEIKYHINEFKSFLTKNNLQSFVKKENIDRFLTESNYRTYLKNFFLSEQFLLSFQINNPDNFYTLFFEIIKYENKLENESNFALQAFIENCIFRGVIEKLNASEITSILKKIKIVANNFDKVSLSIQILLVNSFQNSLEPIKSTNLVAFFVMIFFENIIISESKKFFLNILNKNNFLSYKGIENNHIFKRQKINFHSFFDAQSDYSFSENTAIAYFSSLDIDIIKFILFNEERGLNLWHFLIKYKFLNYIIVNSAVYTIKAMVDYIEENFDDIEKNKFRDAVSKSIFTQNFINNNADKIKILYRLLPINIQQILPAEYSSLKSKSSLFK